MSGLLFFDDDYPLYGGGPHGQIFDFFRRTYFVPSPEEADEAVTTAREFAAFVLAAMKPELQRELAFILEQPQIGYNTIKRRHSTVFPVNPFQLLIVAGPKETAEAPGDESVCRIGRTNTGEAATVPRWSCYGPAA